MKITDMYQTNEACPSLWKCKLDGNAAYIFYRWGYIGVRLDEGKGLWNTGVAGEQIGDDVDGYIEEKEVNDWLIKKGFSL